MRPRLLLQNMYMHLSILKYHLSNTKTIWLDANKRTHHKIPKMQKRAIIGIYVIGWVKKQNFSTNSNFDLGHRCWTCIYLMNMYMCLSKPHNNFCIAYENTQWVTCHFSIYIVKFLHKHIYCKMCGQYYLTYIL